MNEPIRTVLADFPWSYRDAVNAANAKAGKGRRGASGHYPTMTIEEGIALRAGGHRGAVGPLTIAGSEIADNAHLYFWVTNAFMVEAHSMVAAWGFKLNTILTWVKPGMGMGYHWRGATEHVLFCVRGSVRTKRRDCRTWFTGPNARHSQKPQSFYPLIESQSPGPYLELFARRARPGWLSWGFESDRKTTTIVEVEQ